MDFNQSTPSPSKKTRRTRNVLIVVVSVLVLILAFGMGYYLGIITQKDKRISNIDLKEATATTPDKAKGINFYPWERYTSTIVYTDDSLGFSFKYPKELNLVSGKCVQSPSDNSYTLGNALVPLKVVKQNNHYSLVANYIYELGGEIKITGGKRTGTTCKKVVGESNEGQSGYPGFGPDVKEISSNAELEDFIQAYYGDGCKLGEKRLTEEDGVYSATIEPVKKDPVESKCFVNYMYKIKYDSVNNEAFSWKLGQACNYWVEDSNGKMNCFDMEIVDSFKFKKLKPVVSDVSLIKNAMRVYGHGFERGNEELVLKIAKNNGTYAVGTGYSYLPNVAGSSGFRWGAVMLNKQWVIAFVDQQPPQCSNVENSNYNFPIDFVPSCYEGISPEKTRK
jgi:hypothetical protein